VSDVELRQVGKHYGALAAVDNISLRIESGQLVTLLGPSGCGKTTTLNLIAGFMEPDEGAILIGGKVVDAVPPHRRNTSMVFQGYALFPHLTVARNVAFGLEMRRVPKADIARRVTEALDLVQLGGMADRFPRQLSGGQQQRVALARALVVEPDVLLLDEPLSNLDAKLREEMRSEIRRVQQAVGITAIYVTHDQEEALAISDRIVVMNGGRIEQIGTPSEIYRAPQTEFVARFIGIANLLPARVEAVRDGQAVVVLETGTHLSLCAGGAVPGASVTVMVRPEDMEIGAAGAAALPATYEDHVFLGALTFARLTVGSATVRVRTDERLVAGLAKGAPVALGLRPERCLLLPRRPG